MITHQDVIDWKLTQLESGKSDALPKDMQAFVQAHPDLGEELATLELFWQPAPDLPQPSANMRSGFYQALAKEQAQHTARESLASNSVIRANFNSAGSHGRVWLQAAAVAVVFVTGLLTGKAFNNGQNSTELASMSALQQEVARLSTVVAVSMLEHKSASQRLAGVTYSRQANMADPVLMDALTDSLSGEQSTAVKLAIIDALEDSANFSDFEPKLVELAAAETQPLVQISLCQLIFEKASDGTKQALLARLKSITLDADVAEFITLFDMQNRA